MSDAREQISQEDLDVLTGEDLAGLEARDAWLQYARPKQIPPPGEWDTALWLAGRFFGKTRTLTEASWWECFRVPGITWHALAPTIGDVRRISFEGESGFMNKVPRELVKSYNRSSHEMLFNNGSKIVGFGVVEEADRLRGPQCHGLSFDEVAAADRPAGNLESAYKVAALGCRLPYPDGTPSRKLLATTPRPIPFLKALIKKPGTIVIRGTSYENLDNVAKSIQNELTALEGTKYGKQEIYGELLDDDENSIFKKDWIRLWPSFKKLPEFTYIVMSMDTAFEEEQSKDIKKGKDPDYSACCVFGIFNTRQCFSEEELKRLKVKSKYAALLCDFWMERLAFPDLLEEARKGYRQKWGQPGRKPDLVLIENKASGISLRQTMMQYGVPTWPFNPRGQSKTMRAHMAAPMVLQGMLFIPESGMPDRKGQVRDWAQPLLDQMLQFAGDGTIEYDDGMDACVGPETVIITAGGLKRIDEIVPGELVLTHKGRWRAATSITARKAPTYYCLKAKGLDELRLTGDHKVLAMKVLAPANSSKQAGAVEWIRSDAVKPRKAYSFLRNGKPVQSLKRTAHDALVLPRGGGVAKSRVDLADYWPSGAVITKDAIKIAKARSLAVKRFIPMDRESGWVIGLFIAEGCVHRPTRRKGETAYINWACDPLALERVAAWCEAVIGRAVKVGKADGCSVISLGSAVLAPFFEEFGKHASNKRLAPWMLQAPEEFIEGIIDGVAHGDGHVSYRNLNGRQTAITSTSLTLLWWLKLLLARLGRYSSICVSKTAGTRRIFGNESVCQAAYQLSFNDGKKDWTAVNTDAFHGLYVEKLERVDEELVVYDITVEEDHSFVTTGGTVHNCVQAMLHLQEKGYFHAEPQGRAYPDLDEKEEQDKRRAMDIGDREKRTKGGNPYDQ